MVLTQPGKLWLSQELRGHCRQPREKWVKVKNETYGWHAPAVQGCTTERSRVGSFRQRGHEEWHALEDPSLTGDSELTKKALFGRVAVILMTSLSLFVSGREKRKDGREENVSQQAFKETDFLPGEERNADIFLLAAHRHFWLVKRGYRRVSEPCFDWTEGMWGSQCGVQSISGLGWGLRVEMRKTVHWSEWKKRGSEDKNSILGYTFYFLNANQKIHSE